SSSIAISRRPTRPGGRRKRAVARSARRPHEHRAVPNRRPPDPRAGRGRLGETAQRGIHRARGRRGAREHLGAGALPHGRARRHRGDGAGRPHGRARTPGGFHVSLTLFLGLLAWGTLVGLDLVSVPQMMIARPLVAGPIAGAMLGDVWTGLSLGVLFEVFQYEVLPVGAARYPE